MKSIGWSESDNDHECLFSNNQIQPFPNFETVAVISFIYFLRNI